MILYRIVTAQHLDTDTVYQLYRTSLITYIQSIAVMASLWSCPQTPHSRVW